MEVNEIGYIEADKIVYPFLKGRREHERIKTPEEEVRLRFVTSLVLQYQYPLQRIDIEVTEPSRIPENRADIVVYRDEAFSDPYIVVECKQDGLHEREKLQAIEQGFGYANSLRAPYLAVVCGDDEKFYDVLSFPSQERIKNRIPSLPVAYGKAPQYRYSRGGEGWEVKRVDLAELNRRFQRCHDAIWESGKRDPAQSFDEMSMLMVAKYYDENKTPVGGYYRFQIGTNEDAPMVASRIRRVFQESKEQNPSVFATSNITVSDQIVYRVVETLQDISFKDTDIDAKGRAFEKFLKQTFKGELGQYFTPLEIKDFMVEMVGPDEGDFVVDPACGSGGFLLGCMKHVRDKVKQRYAGDDMAVTKADWDFSHKHVWGADINDRIARVAMLGMILNEDGSSNIECHDSLSDFATFQRDDMFCPNHFGVLLTNPPFGGDVFEPKILANFELGSKGNKKRKTQKTEILMLERCLEFLKPGGRMGIVLPDGILTNSSLAYVRQFVEERATLTAVVSLPPHAFKPSADVGVKASLVFLRKKQYPGQEVGDYPIFMAMVEHVGYDATGRDDKNELPEVAEAFFHRSGRLGQIADRPLSYQTAYRQLKGRCDAYYYQPKFAAIFWPSMPSRMLRDLGELAEFSTETRNPTLQPDQEFTYVDISSIDTYQGEIATTQEIIGAKAPSRARRAIRGDQVIVSTVRPTRGAIALVPESLDNSICSTGFAVLKPRPGVNPVYLLYALRSSSTLTQFEQLVTGTSYPAIVEADMQRVKIPLPPRPVQDRIAQMMADAYRERKEKLAKAEELIGSIDGYVQERLGLLLGEHAERERHYTVRFNQLEGRYDPFFYQPQFIRLAELMTLQSEKMKNLGEITTQITRDPNFYGLAFTNEGIPVLKGENIVEGELVLQDLSYISAADHARFQRTKLLPGDLVFSVRGTIGKVALVPAHLQEANINANLIKIRTSPSVTPSYLAAVLNSKFCQLQVSRIMYGTVQATIVARDIKRIKIPLPPRPIQDEIAAEVAKTREEAKRLRQEAEQVVAMAKEQAEHLLKGEHVLDPQR